MISDQKKKFNCHFLTATLKSQEYPSGNLGDALLSATDLIYNLMGDNADSLSQKYAQEYIN